MELCRTELKNIRQLTTRQNLDIVKATAAPCNKRKSIIENLLENSSITEDPILKNYNISMKLQMIELKGRVLEAPDLQFLKNVITSKEIGNKGTWDITNKEFYQPKELGNWIIINFGNFIKDETIDEFIASLQLNSRNHGIKIKDPLNLIDGNNKMSAHQVLEFFIKQIDKYKNLHFVFAIVPGTSYIYSEYEN